MAPQPKVKKLPIPSSGQLLASVVRALELDVANDVAGRYFRGESVSPETRDRVHAMVTEAVVPALGLEAHSKLAVEVVRAALEVSSARWDDVIGLFGSVSRAPADWKSVAPAFAVFAAIELALRYGAAAHLAGSKPFGNEADLAAIVEQRRGLLLRKLAQDAGLSRDRLAEEVGLDAASIDDWLDGRHRPSAANLMQLSFVLAKGLAKEAGPLHASPR